MEKKLSRKRKIERGEEKRQMDLAGDEDWEAMADWRG